ncbi:multicystatin [Danaus plexippus plexippus]|uniref:Multicystatin n=1 Tax=Danaus plexippus plexippus TaxID=278856 RepID=A0A212EZQ5_DANPL|nr:multicystatin [Danaus plexippus plexippus]
MELVYFVYGIFIFNALFYSPVTAHVIGGEVEMDPNDPKYYAWAQEALDKQIGQEKLLVAVVTKATEQLVQGLITRLNFVAQSRDGNYLLICNAKIFEPLYSTRKEMEVDCQLPLTR